VVKQADVVMLIYLLWDRFPASVREANFRYYEPRTGHGSSLSPAIHAAVAARLGDLELASKYFRQAAEIDLSNAMGNAAGGVHAATLGGLWQALVFGFAGVQLSSDGPRVEQPRLPSLWRRLRFTMQWREKRFPVDLRQEGAET
jgi:kojibiose phosphorylase